MNHQMTLRQELLATTSHLAMRHGFIASEWLHRATRSAYATTVSLEGAGLEGVSRTLSSQELRAAAAPPPPWGRWRVMQLPKGHLVDGRPFVPVGFIQ